MNWDRSIQSQSSAFEAEQLLRLLAHLFFSDTALKNSFCGRYLHIFVPCFGGAGTRVKAPRIRTTMMAQRPFFRRMSMPWLRFIKSESRHWHGFSLKKELPLEQRQFPPPSLRLLEWERRCLRCFIIYSIGNTVITIYEIGITILTRTKKKLPS